MNEWLSAKDTPCIFLSATQKTNVDKLRSDIYKIVDEVQKGKYPFNNFLW
jgi:GTP-binding protein HflX